MNDASDDSKPKSTPGSFDFSAFPANTVFHERRTGRDRRDLVRPPPAPKAIEAKDQAGAKAPERRAERNAGSGSTPPRSRSSTPTAKWNS